MFNVRHQIFIHSVVPRASNGSWNRAPLNRQRCNGADGCVHPGPEGTEPEKRKSALVHSSLWLDQTELDRMKCRETQPVPPEDSEVPLRPRSVANPDFRHVDRQSMSRMDAFCSGWGFSDGRTDHLRGRGLFLVISDITCKVAD